MSKKDYELIAAALKQAAGNLVFAPAYAAHREVVQKAWQETVLCLSAALGRQNPRFDVARFTKACGMAA